MDSDPSLSTIVVSWRSRSETLELAAAFPASRLHELLVVDNSGELDAGEIERPGVRLLAPGRNLGFAGGANLGARAAGGALLFFLNPDATPRDPSAYESLRAGFLSAAEAAGLAPRLVDADGSSQHRWQLRRLPTAAALLAHAFFWNPLARATDEPPTGAEIEQPAAAALALRRDVFDRVGGFDEGYVPAWFEDVDLARRLAERRERLLYWPEAEFVHRRGGSLAALGYAGFLVAYDRNLARYLRVHHGRGWALAFRSLVPLGAGLRLAALPMRRPRRAPSRGAAARALAVAAAAALAGWPARSPAP